ncbi:hypothetical protein [Pseudomonas fluorescens]|uniref:Lipoprotein n=1 Tax=Pseudomonas fluorescens TaxID=294 RepID=A0A5E6ZFS9_PSEFL|nr:hypothetical protein [Pseudomonas fluorescens]VVN64625.1 hypothetical protein PS723_00011 [Pseudomonas fluorescens]
MRRAFLFLGLISLLAGCGSEPFQPEVRDSNVHLQRSEQNIYEPGTVIVISNAEFPWAAKDVASVLGSNAKAYDLTLFEARQQVMYNPNVSGLVEVVLNLDQAYETVAAVCRDKETKKVWQETRVVNFMGGRERLARDMTGALVTKVRGMRCP